ncbi:hypothetical protein [Sphingomonas sp. 10B4]|uniref:hypothetical protein n=1 Tax=Sphingomonas sp. 10B4 TaxID=3048575 RepID=UPI002AB579BD|nr:hypothetical protein [Sphingomonas sp. 10B4]MDY7525848.1 hypothetical protein [Sphingomonas sp. 10B4]MEB0281663.1 hypothetical protein [Sphingomonas sp. 10B4]
MTARVFGIERWRDARVNRARVGKAPRLAVRRTILLRQTVAGSWAVTVQEWRFGMWKQPEVLCRGVPLPKARATALAAWRDRRLPLLWAYLDNNTRPFHEGRSEPREARA